MIIDPRNPTAPTSSEERMISRLAAALESVAPSITPGQMDASIAREWADHFLQALGQILASQAGLGTAARMAALCAAAEMAQPDSLDVDAQVICVTLIQAARAIRAEATAELGAEVPS
jgi:hypothetical protein